ncbi:hypothetical protein PLICRDRAFT_573793 [Plicaturopsis crispa FD-325 SS-3]|nr:hypothetical protein PLICRDRAFT_573793 [Plicaturopsis crispa FD-325 SS-3]
MSHRSPSPIHRSTSTELEWPFRDDSEPISDVTARFEGLGRPRMSREDYYGSRGREDDYGSRGREDDYGSRARTEPLPRPSRPSSSSGDLGRGNSPVAMSSNMIPAASSLLDSAAQDKWPFIYQPQCGPSSEGPHPPPLIRGGLVTFGPIPSVNNPPKRPLKRPRPWQPDHSQDAFRDAVSSRWLPGPGYTNAIEPLMLPQLQATPELNPLLGPVPSLGDKSGQHCDKSGQHRDNSGQHRDKSGQHRVSWEILFSPSYACASPAMSKSAWADHLRSPATFPRLRNNLFIVSRSFPWVINAHAEDPHIGITCGDVLDEIYEYLYVLVRQEEVQRPSWRVS